jgi:hypothetical protein
MTYRQGVGVTYFSRSGIIDSQFVTLTETEAAIRLRPSPFE